MTDTERAQALAEKHGATSYRNRADTSNPAFGFTLGQLQALIAEVEQAAPQGWKIVPVIPTSEMVDAACQDGMNLNGRPVWKHTHDVQAAWRWQRMIASAPQPPETARRAPAEPVPQWGKAGTCEWYDGYADHSDGGGPYKERVLYTAPQAPAHTNVWQQAIDHALISAHLGVAGEVTAEEATKILNDLICWNIQVATDPQTNGGKVLVSADALTANNPPGAAPMQLPEPSAWMSACHTTGGGVVWKLSWTKPGVGVYHRLSGEEFEQPLFTEQQVRTLLASRMQRHPLTDSEIEAATGAKQGTALFLAAKGFTLAVERAHNITKDQP